MRLVAEACERMSLVSPDGPQGHCSQILMSNVYRVRTLGWFIYVTYVYCLTNIVGGKKQAILTVKKVHFGFFNANCY